jgi:hypothetical protein
MGLLAVREMWAGLAIAVMWLAVLFDALFGPDIVSTSGPTSSSTAWLATWVVAKHGLRTSRNDR